MNGHLGGSGRPTWTRLDRGVDGCGRPTWTGLDRGVGECGRPTWTRLDPGMDGSGRPTWTKLAAHNGRGLDGHLTARWPTTKGFAWVPNSARNLGAHLCAMAVHEGHCGRWWTCVKMGVHTCALHVASTREF